MATVAIAHTTEASVSPKGALPSICRQAFMNALAGHGQMDDAVYSVAGFCGRKFRLLLNNLIRALDGDARYMEVGIFCGATLCAAISNNAVKVTGIDNWSWDKEKGIAAQFYGALAKFKTHKSPVTIIEANFQDVTHAAIGKHNIYFYDGDHSEKAQYDGITWALRALDDEAIILVDDWNWAATRNGTLNALRDAGAKINYMLELRTSFNNEIPEPAYGDSDWHNGFFAAAIAQT